MLVLIENVQRDDNVNDNEGVTDGQGKIYFSQSINSKQNEFNKFNIE